MRSFSAERSRGNIVGQTIEVNGGAYMYRRGAHEPATAYFWARRRSSAIQR